MESFENPFCQDLDPNNRWVTLASVIPWDQRAGVYYRRMDAKRGAPTLSARMVIEAVILKYMLNIDDLEVVQQITENIYLQYFVGLPGFQKKARLDASPLVSICKRLGWDAFHEGNLLREAVLAYKEYYGCYPEAVSADKLFGTRENRRYMKEVGIRFIGKALGRPTALARQEARRLKREMGRRNAIEGKFGQGKNAYGLGKIRARLKETSESWIVSIYFVMNLVKLAEARGKRLFLAFFSGLYATLQDTGQRIADLLKQYLGKLGARTLSIQTAAIGMQFSQD